MQRSLLKSLQWVRRPFTIPPGDLIYAGVPLMLLDLMIAVRAVFVFRSHLVDRIQGIGVLDDLRLLLDKAGLALGRPLDRAKFAARDGRAQRRLRQGSALHWRQVHRRKGDAQPSRHGGAGPSDRTRPVSSCVVYFRVWAASSVRVRVWR
jgi:hypothetical protein